MALLEYRFNDGSYDDRSDGASSSERKPNGEKVRVSDDEIMKSSHAVTKSTDLSTDGNDDEGPAPMELA
jgi:hypothetical protein